MIHCSIQPFLTYTRSEYLFDLVDGHSYFTPATVFSISSYAGETLKVQLITDDGVLISNVPICALSNDKEAPKLSEEDCVFDLCSDNKIVVVKYEYLAAIERCNVLNRDNTLWQGGIYFFTVEWPETKQQLHLIELDDGNYILWPNEKIIWNSENNKDE